jgi:hypothetical protein
MELLDPSGLCFGLLFLAPKCQCPDPIATRREEQYQKARVFRRWWHHTIPWFADVHGTVDAFGHEASVRANKSDVLSNFNYRLMRNSAFIYDVAHSGLVLGATFNAKLAELFRKIGDA